MTLNYLLDHGIENRGMGTSHHIFASCEHCQSPLRNYSGGLPTWVNLCRGTGEPPWPHQCRLILTIRTVRDKHPCLMGSLWGATPDIYIRSRLGSKAQTYMGRWFWYWENIGKWSGLKWAAAPEYIHWDRGLSVRLGLWQLNKEQRYRTNRYMGTQNDFLLSQMFKLCFIKGHLAKENIRIMESS